MSLSTLPVPGPMAKLMGSAVLAQLARRSYWEAVYTDGRVVREVDGVDWMDLKKRGLKDLRLIGPDGRGVGFANTVDATGRLFQFKGATLSTSLGGGGGSNVLNFHLIGMIRDIRGQCVCFSYEHDWQRWYGPFEDNFFQFAYRGLGPLNPALLND